MSEQAAHKHEKPSEWWDMNTCIHERTYQALRKRGRLMAKPSRRMICNRIQNATSKLSKAIQSQERNNCLAFYPSMRLWLDPNTSTLHIHTMCAHSLLLLLLFVCFLVPISGLKSNMHTIWTDVMVSVFEWLHSTAKTGFHIMRFAYSVAADVVVQSLNALTRFMHFKCLMRAEKSLFEWIESKI